MGDPGAVGIGPGTLYVAPISTSDPTSATAPLPSAFRAVGFTEEGSVFSYSITTEPIEVAESLDPVRIDTTKREGKVTFSMAEMTRANLALAVNAGAAAVNDTSPLEPPDIGTEVRVKIALVTQGGALFLFRRCINGGNTEIARKKSPDKSLIPVEFGLELPLGGGRPWIAYPAANGYLI